ncbi:hypothetical protein ASPCADRAFT_209328 [Aspergillus carbonarius ITEM 5010]|uniref:Uncharacterized protein n=1 Tax=Aspergillus carbonarius (strain ITEM 5010) TaxID=602072 RepID=A0A1R3RFZ6_ASPC5|nr:hypothetical protein ASPCADRAFT_209328 [Aspergillus carbonarius ITEM 5010]
MTSIIRHRPLLTGALVLGTISAYLGKQHLNQTCPIVPLTALPKSSASRKLIDTRNETIPQAPRGLKASTLLSSQPDGDQTHWIPSFVALQAEIPIAQLNQYKTPTNRNDPNKFDAYHLMQNLFAAFIDARAAGPEPWVLDRAVPPLSFVPSSRLFGTSTEFGAFMLGTWSSGRGIWLQPRNLPPDAPRPVAEFCSNEDVVKERRTDVAGAVMYWKFPQGLVRAVDMAASYGLPWRLMEGGFQEYMVEKVSDETARVTYVCVECSNVYPGGERSKRDFKMLPYLLYEAHVLYAQILLYRTLRRVSRANSVVG